MVIILKTGTNNKCLVRNNKKIVFWKKLIDGNKLGAASYEKVKK